MAASIPCSHSRKQPVGQVPQMPAVEGATLTHGSVQNMAIGSRGLAASAIGRYSRWWEQAFPGTADQVRRVRAMVGQLLADCPVADDVVLLMSELAANAVRHSGSRDGGIFNARLLNVPGKYVLGEVMDGGSDWSGDLQGSARDASGLQVLLSLSAACGVSGGRNGRAVWFRVHYPCAEHAPVARAAVSGLLPLQVPGAQELPSAWPRWDPYAPGRIIVGPEVLERVHAALTQV